MGKGNRRRHRGNRKRKSSMSRKDLSKFYHAKEHSSRRFPASFPGHQNSPTCQFSSFSHQCHLKEAVVFEQNKEESTKFVKKHREMEQDIVSRTVFVTCVRDLNRAGNLQLLKTFMSQFGPVVHSFKCHFGGRYPTAKVVFASPVDAERLLNRVKNDHGRLMCSSVGASRGCIRVQAARSDKDLLQNVLGDSTISLTGTNLSLGYWIMGESDPYTSWVHGQHVTQTCDEWFEAVGSALNLNLSIRLQSRSVTLSPIRDDFFRFFLIEEASFRFKDLDGHMEICHQDLEGYCLVFSLKRTPRISSGEERSCDFAGLGYQFGKYLSFKLHVSENDIERLLLSEKLTEMRKFGILRASFHSLQDARTIRSTRIGPPEDGFFGKCEKLHRYNPEIGLLFRSLLDRCRFSWYHTVNDTYPEDSHVSLFEHLSMVQPASAIDALQQVLNGLQKTTRFPCKLLCSIMAQRTELAVQCVPPDYCVMIPRAIATPTRLIVTGIDVDVSNRVVRRFIDEEGFRSTDFMRLRICDEDENRLYGNNLSGTLEERFRHLLLEGIDINGVKFSFLAYSSSQLKELSVWLIAPPPSWSIARIRRTLGNFAGLTPSKYAARIGQCFSTTVQTVHGEGSGRVRRLNAPGLTHSVVDDITAGVLGKEKVHSDGTGLIDTKALQELLGMVPWASSMRRDISLIQIRFGGAKGTLNSYNFQNLPKRLLPEKNKKYDILLRPSMIKFKSEYTFLEVCRVATWVAYYLNRNVILLLKTHGIKDCTFVGMQKDMLEKMDAMMLDRVVAKQTLQEIGGPDSKQKQIMVNLLSTELFDPTHDPFLFSCLLSIRLNHLYALRKKSRILIEKGAVLLGSIDETGILKEGCVFIQLSRHGRHLPLTGPVLVTKHPVMHPGDVRMLLAVDIPELRNTKNVILFSQHGNRPEADKMAGSDLDGDEFAITWDERLFLQPGKVNWQTSVSEMRHALRQPDPSPNLLRFTTRLSGVNFPPMDYDPPEKLPHPPLPLDEKGQTRGLLDHLFVFAKSDSLGAIAMLWQNYVATKGADCDECIQLAKLHSIAVDFPKTGNHAAIPKALRWNDAYPHWREKKDRESYHCRGVIGQLYDDVVGRNELGKIKSRCNSAICGRRFNRNGQVDSQVPSQKRLRACLKSIFNPEVASQLGLTMSAKGPLGEWERNLLSIADEQRGLFENDVASIMNKFHLANEGELFTGCIRKFHNFNKKKQSEVSDEVRRQCHIICSNYRALFFSKIYELTQELIGEEDPEDDLLLASKFASLEIDETIGSDNDSGDGEEDDSSMEDGTISPSQEDLEMIEAIVTRENEFQPPVSDLSVEATFRRVARSLAGAYYVVTYSPERQLLNDLLLFSFPWVVSDVIKVGLLEKPFPDV